LRAKGVPESVIQQARARANQPMQLKYPEFAKEIDTGNIGDMALNAIGDTFSTLGHGATVGTAKVLDAAGMAKDFLSLNDTSLVEPDKLVSYSQGGRNPRDQRSYYILENIAKQRPNDLDIQFLYNAVTNGNYQGTAEDAKKILDKSQKYHHEDMYNAIVQPSVNKMEDFLEEASTRHSLGNSNFLRGLEGATEVIAPTVLSGGLGASAPISMGIGGAVQGENKMQQYLNNGIDYTEAAKNVPIETAKGLLFGTALKAFGPSMQVGIIQNPANLGEAARNILIAFRNGSIVGSTANLGTQALDLFKEDPNFDYVDWGKVEQGIKEGKYADLDGYLNSRDYTNDWVSSRTSQIFWAGMLTGGFNAASQIPSTMKAVKNALSDKFNASKQLEADLKILGLEKDATPQEVRKAAHQLQKKYHSDITGTSANDAKLQEINEAYNRIQRIQSNTASSFITKLKNWASNLSKNTPATNIQPTQVNNAAVASDQALVPYANNTMANATNLGNIATQQATIAAQPAPQNIAEPVAQTNKITTDTALEDVRDFKEVGNRKVNAYQYDNPEVKPFFQHEARSMLQDLNNAIKGERTATEDVFGNLNYTGITRETTQDIADLLDGKKKRKHVETLANSPSIPDQVAEDIRKDPRATYTPQSNEETLNTANQIIDGDYEKAERRFLEKDLESAEDVAVADLLIQKATADGNYDKADELAISLSEKLTKAGQVVQAASIIKRLSPEGMLIYANKELNNAVETIKKDNPNEYKKLVENGVITEKNGKGRIKLTEAEQNQIVKNMKELENTNDERQKDILIGKTLTLIGNKIPATTLEKIASLRRNGLLANLKTLNRNIGSNGAFGTLENIKDIPATVFDLVTSLITGQRTTRLPNLKAYVKGFKKGGKYAVQDLYYGIDTGDSQSGKYGIPGKAFKRLDTYNDILDAYKSGQIKKGTKALFNRLLSDYEDIAGFLVNGTDRPFWQGRFESELANQMKLNGLKYGIDIPTNDMLEIAKESADYATFKNKNTLSSSLSSLKNLINNGKPIGAADALGLTFTNVPGSVGSKIYDYTAGGYIKAIKEIYNAASKNGKFNQRRFVDYLARSVTGTGAIGLLVLLISKGIITGSYDDDKDKADLEREMGIQKNAINLSALQRFIQGKDTKLQKGDKFYNFDWLQPVSGLGILGANLYKKATGNPNTNTEGIISNLDDENEYYVKKKTEPNYGDLALEALATTANQVVDMSSLGNFSDLFKGYEGIGGNLVDIPGNFASSFIPTISNNISQYQDETARQTKDYTSRFKTNLNKIINKIPGLRETLTPKVNTLGEEKQQYVDGNDFVSTFINPGYMTTYNPTDVQNELMSVYEETGDKTIFPAVSPGSITYKKETVQMKPKGNEAFQKASGKYVAEVYDALLDSEFYKSLDADKKAKVLSQIATDGRDVGKAAIGIDTDNYLKLDAKRDLLDDAGMSLADYYLYASQLKGVSGKQAKITYIANITNSINEKQGKDYIDKNDKAILYDIFGVN
jgi:hypothetical protein